MCTKLQIGGVIKKQRLNLGLTQEKIAEDSNLSVNFISRIERNISDNVSIETLVALADTLQVTPAQLLNNSVEMFESQPNTQRLMTYLRQLDPDKQNTISGSILQLLKSINS